MARWRSLALKVAFSTTLTLLLLELACRVVVWRELKQFDGWVAHPYFYYQRSSDPVLGYELKHDYSCEHEGRRVHVNRQGLRDDHDDIPEAPRRIAVLGDSVVFGIGQTQEATLSEKLQRRLDPGEKRVRVLNFGVPGYAVREVAQFLRDKDAVYHTTDVVYVLNPNDFACRDTRFEGADSGLYRVFYPPSPATLALVRKFIWRTHKGGLPPFTQEPLVSVPWYKWLFAGNRDRAYDVIRTMKAYARERGIAFAVLPLPSGAAFSGGSYALDGMYDDILGFLRAEGIRTFDARTRLNQPAYFDDTDHLTTEGDDHMVDMLAGIVGAP